MKLLTTLAAFFIGMTLFAQTKVNEEFVIFDNEKGNGFSVKIINMEPDDAIDELKDYLKEYDGKAKAKGKNLFIENAEITVISNYPCDVHATSVIEEGDHTLLKIGFAYSGKFISTEDEEGKKAKVLVYTFADKLNKENAAKKLEEQADLLKKLEKDKEGLLKDKEDYKKTIEKAKKEISDAESNLEKNAKAISEKETKIASQKAAVKAAEGVQSKF